MSHDGVGLRAVMRSVAFLTAGVLAVPAARRVQLRRGRGGKPRRRAGHRARRPATWSPTAAPCAGPWTPYRRP